jgi:hypothetical protein
MSDAAPAPSTRVAFLVVPVLVGAAVAAALGVFSRLHTPTGEALWIGPFPSLSAMKVWLTIVVLALALVQLVSALWMYGRLGLRPPKWTGTLHRTVGVLAVLVSLPVAANCVWALGLESYSLRVLAHGLLGCAVYGALVAKVLSLHSRRLPKWAVPVMAGLLFTAVVGVGVTGAVWYLATQGAALVSRARLPGSRTGWARSPGPPQPRIPTP